MSRFRTWALALFVVLQAAASVAAEGSGASLAGVLQLGLKGKPAPLRAADPREAIVYFRPAGWQGTRAGRMESVVTTADKRFQPRVTVVPPGTEIRFPNQDPILHNVFSVSGENRFDVGLYGKGPGPTWVAEHPGVVRVFCNVHHDMVAYILVLDTPFVARPDRDGRFRLDGLPERRGTLYAWHDRAEAWERELTAADSGELELALEITRPRVPPHLNKLGQPYRRDGRGSRYP